jgi:hypothetical protein
VDVSYKFGNSVFEASQSGNTISSEAANALYGTDTHEGIQAKKTAMHGLPDALKRIQNHRDLTDKERDDLGNARFPADRKRIFYASPRPTKSASKGALSTSVLIAHRRLCRRDECAKALIDIV